MNVDRLASARYNVSGGMIQKILPASDCYRVVGLMSWKTIFSSQKSNPPDARVYREAKHTSFPSCLRLVSFVEDPLKIDMVNQIIARSAEYRA